MGVRAGALDRLVVLQRRVETTDSSRQVVIEFVDIDEVWAAVEPLGGRTNFGQAQFVATGDVRIRIRWRDDVNPLHRVVDGEFEYDVVSVAPVGREEELWIVGRSRAEQRDT